MKRDVDKMIEKMQITGAIHTRSLLHQFVVLEIQQGRLRDLQDETAKMLRDTKQDLQGGKE